MREDQLVLVRRSNRDRFVGVSSPGVGLRVLRTRPRRTNRVMPLGERHFRRLITEFVAHYHRERNHQGLGNRLIVGTPTAEAAGRVHRHQRLGGSLNYYQRAA